MTVRERIAEIMGEKDPEKGKGVQNSYAQGWLVSFNWPIILRREVYLQEITQDFPLHCWRYVIKAADHRFSDQSFPNFQVAHTNQHDRRVINLCCSEQGRYTSTLSAAKL